MLEKLTHLLLASVVMSICVVVALAQTRDPSKCRGPIYSAKEVTKRARVHAEPNFRSLYEAFGRNVHAHVTLEAVLCRSGRITDIHVTESKPPKVAEFVAAAVGLMNFAPAEMNWHTVSQTQTFEFSINEERDAKPIDPGVASGRLVERLEIVGNRRLTAKEIMSWIKTRPGEPYNAEQIKRDFDAILATGYFDKLYTRVSIEDAVRGGVTVIFEVAELPLINEIRFVGLTLDQSWVMETWRSEKIDLRTGSVFKIEEARAALRVIERLLAATGQGNLKAEWKIEQRTAQTVDLTIAITVR